MTERQKRYYLDHTCCYKLLPDFLSELLLLVVVLDFLTASMKACPLHSSVQGLQVKMRGHRTLPLEASLVFFLAT